MSDGLPTLFVNAVSVGADGVPYASVSGAVFRALDGEHWTAAGGGLTDYVAVLVADPFASGTLYAGTSDGRVFKTLDGAATWTDASVGLPPNDGTFHPIAVIAVNPSIPSVIFAAVHGKGLFVSNDGAGTWTRAGTGHGSFIGSDVRSVAFDPSSTSTMYVAVSGGGIFKSTDGGTIFQSASSGLPHPYITLVVVDPRTAGTVYAATDQYTGGFFKSTDAGTTWAPAANGLIGPPKLGALLADPAAAGILYAGLEGPGVFKTTDGAGSWTPADHGIETANTSALAIDPLAPNTIYAGTSGGVAKSTDCAETWTRVNTGLGGAEVGALAIDPSTTATVYAGLDYETGVFKSTDGGALWQPAGSALALDQVPSLVIDPRNPATVYAGTSGGYAAGVMKSVDGGATWNSASRGLATPDCIAGGVCPGPVVEALVMDPTSPDTLYAAVLFVEAGEEIFKTVDGAATWSALSSVGGAFVDSFVEALVVDPQSPTTLYLGSVIRGVLKSTDGGVTWSPRNAGLTSLWVAALAIDPLSPTILYAGIGNADVYRSVDGGESWTAFNDGFAARGAFSLAIDPVSPNRLYAGSEAGVFAIELSCGNGRIDPGEECDHAARGDCCSPVCTFEPSGSACADDGSICTSDICDGAGACRHGFALDAGCAAAGPRGASVELARSADASGNRVRWSWTRDPAPTKGDFANPLSATDYTLCVGDASGRVLLESTAAAGPRWRETRRGFDYATAASGAGLRKVHLGSRLRVSGRGTGLALGPLPPNAPVVARVTRGDGAACWEAIFGTPAQSDEDAFRARSD